MLTNVITRRAALAHAALALVTLLMAVVVLPAAGLRNPADLADPARVRALAGPLLVIEALKVLSAAAGAALVLGVYQGSRGRATRVAAAAGWASAALLALAGGRGALSLPPLALFGHDAAALNAVVNRLGVLAVAFFGLWALVVNGLWLRAGAAPRWLAVLGLAWGLAGVLAPLAAPAALLALVLGMGWCAGIGLGRWTHSYYDRTITAS